MPGLDLYSMPAPQPVKTLHGIPNHVTYRDKLVRKWRNKGFQVRFV